METTAQKITAEALIHEIEHTYAEILWLYRSMPVEKIVAPSLGDGRSVKDLVAHIAAWEWRCASLLEASHLTDTPLLAEPDVDALNREIHRERATWPWEEVEFDARKAHETLIQAIRQLPPERLNNPVVYEAIVQETSNHYIEHIVELRQWYQNHR